MHIRKTIIISHLPALPGDLLDDSWKLNSAGPGGSTPELDSRGLGQLWQDLPHPPFPVKETCHQCRPRAGPGTHTLTLSLQLEPISSPQFSLLDLLLVRAAVPALRGNKPDPGLALCGAGAAVQPEGLEDSNRPVRRGTGRGGGKAQVNTAALWPMRAGGGCRQTAGWRGPRGFRERKGSVQHIQLCPRHRREGWARQRASSSSCPAGRWRESSLSFQRSGPAGTRRSTDPQEAAHISRWGGWSTGCSGPQGGREGRANHCREERPAASLMLLSTVGYLQEEEAGHTWLPLLVPLQGPLAAPPLV